MWMRSLLIWVVLVAAGVGLSVGLDWSSGTLQWIAKGGGIVMIIAGATIFFTPAGDQRSAQLSGSGVVLLGAAQWLPATWKLGMLLVAIVLTGASILRRRRVEPVAPA